MKISRRHSIKSVFAKLEYPESSFIPYDHHWDSHTLITKNRELLQTLKLEGFAFETADDEDVDLKKSVRNNLFKSIGTGNYALWFHTIRRKRPVTVEGAFPLGFAEYVERKWRRKHENQVNYSNDLYITIVYKKDTQGAAKLEQSLKMLASPADREAWKFELVAAANELTDLTSRLIGSLKEYRPRCLGIRKTKDGEFSELMEFLGAVVNCGEWSPMLVPSGQIARYLPTHRLYFGKRAMEVRGPDNKSRYAGMISIREYSAKTNAGMLDAFLRLPFEFVMAQSFIFTNRQDSIAAISLHQRRMKSGGDKAVSQANELSNAMDLAMSGHIAFGRHHLSLVCITDSLKQLEDATSLAYGELVNSGMMPVRETINMQPAYWAQLPANFPYIARGAVINTFNLASFVSLHNYPIGKRDGNHWGPAVTLLDTTSGTPYFFSFHVRDVGHTTIIGPTGAGKTVLMNFLCAQAQKFNCRMFFFDKDRGAELFIRALGGNYAILEPGKVSGFNPLQLEDTPENRGFLVDWLRTLVKAQDETFESEWMDTIYEAVEGNYKLPKEERYLTNIVPFMGLEGPGTLAGRMGMWHGAESHASFFDNKVDTIDFTKAKIFGFEMGEILKDGLSLGPVLMYLFHRINMSLDGTPTMIVLDEAWALIDNDVFAPRIKNWLKVLRKLNAIVIFATQSVEDASRSNISDTLIQQTATQFFLANPKATEEYRKSFMLTQREFTLIKTIEPSSRYFLLKQGTEVVVARVDLDGMDDVINVLSGRAETVRLLDRIIAEVGDNPDVWLPEFNRRVKELRK